MPADHIPQPGRARPRVYLDQDMPDRAILAHDLDGRIIDANRRFLGMAGYARKDLIGQPIAVLQEMDGGQARLHALSLLQRGQLAHVDLAFRGFAGDVRNLAAVLLPLNGKAGLSGVVIIGRDTGHPVKAMPLPAALEQAA
ncbi:PAS domain-containing protein [Paracoccus sp. DMF-8]|uniref:PAS domain-containing protein n=1 Tax=Paracoccus sp. DMF-8 TaxID=3019445 RepID=UPI0023E7AFBC|nr:PAS domain-containing protein [Paracoccus sp. DMF-8]MDF3606248.1 PAS domain-containing protein [Paracoccus sp. DMF-8]